MVVCGGRVCGCGAALPGYRCVPFLSSRPATRYNFPSLSVCHLSSQIRIFCLLCASVVVVLLCLFEGGRGRRRRRRVGFSQGWVVGLFNDTTSELHHASNYAIHTHKIIKYRKKYITHGGSNRSYYYSRLLDVADGRSRNEGSVTSQVGR